MCTHGCLSKSMLASRLPQSLQKSQSSYPGILGLLISPGFSPSRYPFSRVSPPLPLLLSLLSLIALAAILRLFLLILIAGHSHYSFSRYSLSSCCGRSSSPIMLSPALLLPNTGTVSLLFLSALDSSRCLSYLQQAPLP